MRLHLCRSRQLWSFCHSCLRKPLAIWVRLFAFGADDTCFTQQLDGGCKGESHDVEEVSFNAGDPPGGVALNAVGAGLVQRIARCEVGTKFPWGDRPEGHSSRFHMRELPLRCADRDARTHLVRLVAETEQHLPCFVEVL